MELYFTCPLTLKGFSSEKWQIEDELRVREDRQGNRSLVGTVAVECPHCGGVHSFRTEELACPWSQAGM
jgi:hypothetical protein